MNSFSAISRAIDYEISRQILLHKENQADQIVQETRLWDESSQVVISSWLLACVFTYLTFPRIPKSVSLSTFSENFYNAKKGGTRRL